jgi:hypothetical protein
VLREPAEKGVAGAVPEAVVVGLEAVEVEQEQDVRCRIVLFTKLLEADDDGAPVEEAGERVGQRLVARPVEQPQVLAERHREASEHRSQPECGGDDGDGVLAAEVIPGEEREADEPEPGRDGDHPPTFQPTRTAARAGRGRRGRDEHERRQPADVQPRAVAVGPLGDLVEVCAVADCEEAEPAGDRGARSGRASSPRRRARRRRARGGSRPRPDKPCS